MTPPPRYLRVAVPCPLYRVFDYLPPAGVAAAGLQPGLRVRVPFGRQQVIGVLLETAAHSELPAGKLRRADAVLDEAPLIGPELLQLARWAAAYYQHPPGEVMEHLFPGLLRRGRAAPTRAEQRWRLTPAGRALASGALSRAPRQQAVWTLLQATPAGLPTTALPAGSAATLRAMQAKGLIEQHIEALAPAHRPAVPGPPLNAAQQAAVQAVTGQLDSYHAVLLDGVTGSGKTEVYLACAAAALATGRQVLILVPEIGLTPQLLARVETRLGVPVAAYHSALSEGERHAAWRAAQQGAARVLLGTRSAVWASLPELGLIVVDEEHDASYKQQEGFRYSARDLAVLRAQRGSLPVLLGSATPALETLHNVTQRRYRQVHLPERAGGAAHPELHLLDIRGQPLNGGLGAALQTAVGRHLDAGGQVLLYLNRRGFAPVLMCHTCGDSAQCARCDARLTYHRAAGRLRCHHCGAERAVPQQCPACGSLALQVLGKGTERLEDALAERFPGVALTRIDRDTTRARGALDKLLAGVHSGAAQLLIGTQMLAKGHDFPNLTLVGVVDADQGLFSTDFRAAERLVQTILQVAGRAGRGDKPGEVLIQTHHPDHPVLRRLLAGDYAACAATLLAERQAAGLPPYQHLALLRAEAVQRAVTFAFLETAKRHAGQPAGITFAGPAPAPMERRAGRYRAQLLLSGASRTQLQAFLAGWVPALAELPMARRVRWSLDVDPLDTF